MLFSSTLTFLVLPPLFTSANAIALTFYRINTPSTIDIPQTTHSTPTPTFSIEKPGTTVYTALNAGSSGMVPWEVKEIAYKIIAHLPSTTVTLNQPTTRTCECYVFIRSTLQFMAHVNVDGL
ncbi:hypothetical protein BJ165DRAFT_1507649 [Panaeolus papilionaceus]|nr:hypothetical protein BJ165DRAFT_1507649 [Panaeolus papilionaceus]